MKKPILVMAGLLAGSALLVACEQGDKGQMATPAAPPQAAAPAQTPAPATSPAAPAQASAPQQAPAAGNNMISGTVMSVMNAGGYTYVELKTADGNIWAAGPKSDIERGSQLNVMTLMPMQNFHSKALNRDFDLLYFVDVFRKPGDPPPVVGAGQVAHADAGSHVVDISGMSGNARQPAAGAPAMPARPVSTKSAMAAADLPMADGGQSIAEVHANRKELGGKPVKVRGKVTKFTPGIMKKNWLHLKDASTANTAEDLIVTTDAVASMGDVVLIEGNLSLDRDFGFGYFYETLVEDAKVTVE